MPTFLRNHIRKANQYGFSLMELLVVIVIIGIMTNAAAYRYLRSKDKRDKVQTEGRNLASLFRAASAAGTSVGANVVVDMRRTAVCSGGSPTTPMVQAYVDRNYNNAYDGTSSIDDLVGEWTTPDYCKGTVGNKDVQIDPVTTSTGPGLRTTPTLGAGYTMPAGVEAQMVFLNRGDSWYRRDNTTSDPDYNFNVGGATKMSGQFMRITTTGTAYPTTDKRAWVTFGICTYTGSVQVYNGHKTLGGGTSGEPCM